MAQSSSELLGHLQETSEGDLMELALRRWQWILWALWAGDLELHSISGCLPWIFGTGLDWNLGHLEARSIPLLDGICNVGGAHYRLCCTPDLSGRTCAAVMFRLRYVSILYDVVQYDTIWYDAGGICHSNTTEHHIVMRQSLLFPSRVTGFNVVADERILRVAYVPSSSNVIFNVHWLLESFFF